MLRKPAGVLGLCCALVFILTCAASATPGTAGSGALQFSASDYEAAAGATAITVSVTRVGGASGVAVASYQTSDGSASAGIDYAATGGTLTWLDGDSAPKSVTVTLNPAAGRGGSFTVALISASGAGFGEPISSTVSIGAPGALQFSADTYAAAAGAASIDITVERVGGASGTAIATYSTLDGSGVAGSDYIAASGSLTWADGDSAPKTFSVRLIGGASASVFNVALLSASGAGFGDPIDATVAVGAQGAGDPGTLAFSSASYRASSGPASIDITVDRVGGASGIAIAGYQTSDGSAVAGTDYTPASGTLTWADGDSAPKTFSVRVAGGNVAPKAFNDALVSASGASFGSPKQATVSIDAIPSPSNALSIRAEGNHLVDGNNNVVQLRGANYSSMEGAFQGSSTPFHPTNPAATAPASVIQGYSNGNLGPYPWWGTAAAWRMNVFRIPLNEAAWLRSYTGVDPLNAAAGAQQPDVSGNYQAAVKQMVSDLVDAGFYVILDLHWSAPGAYLGTSQDQLPDEDHSVAFWTSMAQYFGNNPAVIFDLFNEPYPTPPAGSGGRNIDVFDALLNGAAQSTISCNSGLTQVPYTWNSVGMQELVDTVRAAGATNLLLIGGAGGATDLSGFTAAGGGYFPTDPLNNLAASWHAYGVSSASDMHENATYSGTINPTAIADALLDEGIPVVVGEVGDASSNGTVGAPVISNITHWADQNGGSVVAWTWDVWNGANGPGPDNLLIKNASGSPTDGEGVAFQTWLLAH